VCLSHLQTTHGISAVSVHAYDRIHGMAMTERRWLQCYTSIVDLYVRFPARDVV
jgi:hypothetical protein